MVMITPQLSRIVLQPATAPLSNILSEGSIIFCHPGYDDGLPFLQLAKYDLAANGKRGLHLGTALRACEIVANNQPGFLSVSNDSADKEAIIPSGDLDMCLFDTKFYYHVFNQETDIPYRLCAFFRAWTLPGGDDLPAEWQSGKYQDTFTLYEDISVAEANERVKAYDQVCCITGSETGSLAVHLIPPEEKGWFLAQGVGLEDVWQPRIYDIGNMMMMRSDVSSLMDQARFAMVPKAGQIVTSFILQDADNYEVAGLFHNHQIHIPDRINPVYLYCRFAQAIFSLVNSSYLNLLLDARVRKTPISPLVLALSTTLQPDELILSGNFMRSLRLGGQTNRFTTTIFSTENSENNSSMIQEGCSSIPDDGFCSSSELSCSDIQDSPYDDAIGSPSMNDG